MNVNLLVDAIVRQTTVLIAQLATAAGARATLAHTANKVFIDLVSELKSQGIGNKVIADMFGLTLRAYHHKVARLSESGTDRGRSLWEALLSYVQQQGSVSRTELLTRFAVDDETSVRGVLNDLVDSGLVFRAGRSDQTLFRAADEKDYARLSSHDDAGRLDNLLWVVIYRFGPLAFDELTPQVPAETPAIEAALARLLGDGRIRRDDSSTPTRYASEQCVIAIEDEAGWEAAVFDHYQAVVTAICTKLRMGTRRARWTDSVGGSTFGFDLWKGHPLASEVLGFLRETRERAVALRRRVTEHNQQHSPGDDPMRVIAYVGQTIVGPEHDDEEEGAL